jgi:hypothetical protein
MMQSSLLTTADQSEIIRPVRPVHRRGASMLTENAGQEVHSFVRLLPLNHRTRQNLTVSKNGKLRLYIRLYLNGNFGVRYFTIDFQGYVAKDGGAQIT